MTRSVPLSSVPEDVRAKLSTVRQRTSKKAIVNKLREASEANRDEEFRSMLRRSRLPSPVAEHRFHETRRWRFDYAWVAEKIALEVEGGAFTNGRHTRGKGFIEDMSKYSEAALAGWIVLRVIPASLTSRQTESWIRRALRSREMPDKPHDTGAAR